MSIRINQIYLQINETLNSLLSLKEQDKLEGYMQNFREGMTPLENLSDADLAWSLKNNRNLIIRIFQFKTIAQDKVWSDLPRVRSYIANLITNPTPYEDEFREEVEKFGWGEFLDYIKD